MRVLIYNVPTLSAGVSPITTAAQPPLLGRFEIFLLGHQFKVHSGILSTDGIEEKMLYEYHITILRNGLDPYTLLKGTTQDRETFIIRQCI